MVKTFASCAGEDLTRLTACEHTSSSPSPSGVRTIIVQTIQPPHIPTLEPIPGAKAAGIFRSCLLVMRS